MQRKVETVKQNKEKANHKDEKKDAHEISVKKEKVSKMLREDCSLNWAVGLKRVTKTARARLELGHMYPGG